MVPVRSASAGAVLLRSWGQEVTGCLSYRWGAGCPACVPPGSNGAACQGGAGGAEEGAPPSVAAGAQWAWGIHARTLTAHGGCVVGAGSGRTVTASTTAAARAPGPERSRSACAPPVREQWIREPDSRLYAWRRRDLSKTRPDQLR